MSSVVIENVEFDWLEGQDHEIHELANLFPMMDEQDYQILKGSIVENGQLEPIVRDGNGLVIDGRNRLRACIELGIDPWFSDDDVDDILTWVVCHNLERRHLTDSQRAMIGHELRENKGVTRGHAAAAVKVSERLLSYAKSVSEEGIDGLADAVKSGDIPLTVASEVAKLPDEDQDEVLNGSDEEDAEDETEEPVAAAATRREGLKSRANEAVAEKLQKAPENFDFGKWTSRMTNMYSKAMARVPEDLGDRAKRWVATDLVNATVRLAADGAPDNNQGFNVLTPADIVGEVKKHIRALPKEDRPEATELLIETFGEHPKKATELLLLVTTVLEGMSQAENKRSVTGLFSMVRDMFESNRPAEYLPKMSESPADAVKTIKAEVTHRVKQLAGYTLTEDAVSGLSSDIEKAAKKVARDHSK